MKKFVVTTFMFFLALFAAQATESDALSLDEGEEGIDEIKTLLLTDINAQDGDGSTALYMASSNGYTEVAKALIETGANLDTQTNEGRTALYIASFNGHTEIVKALLEAGADLTIQNNYGRTALWGASYQEHADIVTLLKEAGATIPDPVTTPTASAKARPSLIETIPTIYTGLGLSGGYVTDDLVDMNNNDSILGLANFIIPIQFSIAFWFDYDFVVSIRLDTSFDFGNPFKVGGTLGGLIDFSFFNGLSIGIGGGYRRITDSAKNITVKGTGFPYARMTVGGMIGSPDTYFWDEWRGRPTFFVDFMFPDEGNFGLNIGFMFMFDANYLWVVPLALIWGI